MILFYEERKKGMGLRRILDGLLKLSYRRQSKRVTGLALKKLNVMKTHPVVYIAVAGLLFLGCTEKEADSYTDAMQDEVATGGELVGDEANMEKLDSPEPLGQHALVDTLQLPEPLLVILHKDPATAPDKIKNVRQYTEQGIEYYEITFDTPVEEMQKITYDNLGRIKSPDLDKPDN